MDHFYIFPYCFVQGFKAGKSKIKILRELPHKVAYNVKDQLFWFKFIIA